MAVKYRASFSNIDLKQVVIDLEVDSYVGYPISVIGVGKETLSFSRTAASDPYASHVIPTTANISLYSDLIDVDEIQMSNDKDWLCTIYVDGVMKFKGFLVPDGVQRTLKGAGNIVRLNATCGLGLMNGNKLTWHGSNWGSVIIDGQESINTCPMNFLRQIFDHSDHIGTGLPIRWFTSVKYVFDPTRDFFAGIMPFSSSYTLSELLLFNKVDTYWFIENLMKPAKCWVFQENGYWNIVNLEDIAYNDGIVEVLEIPSNVGSVTATRSTIDLNVDYTNLSILDDAYTMYSRSVGKVNVVYDHVQNENILPNGGFDTLASGAIAQWGWLNSGLTVPPYDSLDGRSGHAADLSIPSGGAPDSFSTAYQMNIDGNVLYEYINLKFTVLPLNGFPYDSKTGIIKWGIDTLKVTVYYDIMHEGVATRFFLNEFGYWTNGTMDGNQEVVDTFWDGAQNSFNIEFNQDRDFYIGDQVNISYVRDGGVINKTVVFYETMDLQSGVQHIVDQIQDGFITNPNNWTVSINNTDNDPRNTASVTKVADYAESIRFHVDNARIGDIIKYEFRSTGGDPGIKLPDPGNLDSIGTARGKLRVLFHVNPGQRYILDNVIMTVDSNQDRYELTLNERNSEENYSMGISSSFSGFYLTSFIENSGNANKFMLFSDYGASNVRLTELYGRGVLNWRNKARKIYNGSFKVDDFSFLSLVRIGDKKFVPLGVDYNVTSGQINNLVAFESDIDVVSPTVIHTGNVKK